MKKILIIGLLSGLYLSNIFAADQAKYQVMCTHLTTMGQALNNPTLQKNIANAINMANQIVAQGNNSSIAYNTATQFLTGFNNGLIGTYDYFNH